MNIDTNKPICILGNVHTGKTNLSFFLASKCTHPKRYTLGYPQPIEGYINLSSMQDLTKIDNCVLLIDEIDQFIPIYEKKSNEALQRLLKFAEHNNIKLIFNTQLSQFINKMMEALVPCWAITEIDIFSLKNGSKPKRILLDYLRIPTIVNKEVGMRLPLGNFIWYDDLAEAGINGVKQFDNMNIGKDWGMTKHDKKKAVQELSKSL